MMIFFDVFANLSIFSVISYYVVIERFLPNGYFRYYFMYFFADS